MLLKSINPFVRQSIVSSLKSTNETDTFKELQTRDCRLYYILSDKGFIIINGTTYELHRGDVILFQSGTKYLWKPDRQNEIHYMAINFDYTQNFSHIKNSQHPISAVNFKETDIFESIYFEDAIILNNPIFIERLPSLENQIRLLTVEFYLGKEYCDELLSSTIKSLIISIVRSCNSSYTANNSKDLELIRKVIEYIQNHYAENITNDIIATAFFLNPVYLNRLFKSGTNMSIHEFVLNYRLNIALGILRSETTPIQEIALMVGFRDPVHFNKIFKKHIGITPNRFRQHKE